MKQRVTRVMVGSAIVAGALFGWLAGLDESGLLTPENTRLVDGRMYSAPLPGVQFPFVSKTDTVSKPYISPLRLFENDRELGPAHSLHATVRQAGDGVFSHWNGDLLFSTSDNSDPRENGRAYRFETRIFLSVWVAGMATLLGGLLCWPSAAALYRRLQAISARRRTNLVGVVRVLVAPKTAGAAASLYCLFICMPALVTFIAVGEWTAPRAIPALGANQPLENRVAAYLGNPKPYSVIFLGDSRTYCNVQTELLEPLVPGLHALNLSNFANWFPTQLGLIREIVEHIPPRTFVVWSIGHQNFSSIGSGVMSIQRVYPIDLLDAVRLTWWNSGRMPRGLFDNISYYQPSLHGFVAAKELRGTLDGVLKRPLFRSTTSANLATEGTLQTASTERTPVAQQEDDLTAAVRAIEQQVVSESGVVQANVTTDEGRITSIVRYFRRGGYHRTEIDVPYFRAKQAAMGYKRLSDVEADAFKPPPPAAMEWRTFLAILDIFAEHRIRLVVNEFEEASFVYGHPLVRTKWRTMMRDVVQPEIERRGFTYIRTNLDELSDYDYFDFDHMNSKGIEKYTPMLALRLKEFVVDR